MKQQKRISVCVCVMRGRVQLMTFPPAWACCVSTHRRVCVCSGTRRCKRRRLFSVEACEPPSGKGSVWAPVVLLLGCDLSPDERTAPVLVPSSSRGLTSLLGLRRKPNLQTADSCSGESVEGASNAESETLSLREHLINLISVSRERSRTISQIVRLVLDKHWSSLGGRSRVCGDFPFT